MLKGVDTNIIYQRNDLSAQMIKAEGARFNICALTQGAYWYGRGTKSRIDATRKAGMVAGAYHFLTRVIDESTGVPAAWNGGAEQCQFFIDNLPGGRSRPSPGGLLIAVDVENAPATTFQHGGRSVRQDPNGPTWRIVRDFVNHWFAVFPQHPLFVYSSWGEWFRDGRDVQALNDNVFCWNADWVRSGRGRRLGRQWNAEAIAEFQRHAALAKPDVPRWGGFEEATLWQCGGFGIKGYGKVDGNLFDGTVKQLRAYTHDRATDGQADDAPVVVQTKQLLEPYPIGSVRSLGDAPIAASVRLERGATHVTEYQVELAPRGTPHNAFRGDLLWDAAGGPVQPDRADLDDEELIDVEEDLDEDVVDEPPPDVLVDGLRFDTLDGQPASRKMVVNSATPVAVLVTARPIKSYSWELWQHSRLVDGSERPIANKGIDDGRLGFSFEPSWKLCRMYDPPVGHFHPPFRKRNVDYHGVTYFEHSDFAVDFNWKFGNADEGHAVLAVAPGRWIEHKTAFGQVFVNHFGGKFRAEYAHMSNASIRAALQKLRQKPENADEQKQPLVDVGDLLGRISDQGSPGAIHLHHKHFGKVAGDGFTPTQMSFGREPVPVSRPFSFTSRQDEDWVSKKYFINGWNPESGARFVVTVRFEDDPQAPDAPETAQQSLRFYVEGKRQAPAKRPATGTKTHSRRGQRCDIVITHVFDGNEPGAGEYTIRYRCKDDREGSRWTPWAYDDSVVIDPALKPSADVETRPPSSVDVKARARL